MSLSGNLGFVPIDEVLRLLTRARQQGAVEVTGIGLSGRVFVGKGGIDLATTWADDDLHRHLLNSGYSDEGSLRRVTTGETTLAAVAESNQDMIDLLREMTVESLYQIGRRGDEFRVREGATTAYASPKSFELESLIEDTKDRQRDWDKVAEIIPDLASAIRFRRDLGEREEVTVKVDDWKVLSEIGTGASVSEIADQLGTTEFWTARVAARLAKNDLIVLTSGPVRVSETTTPVDEVDEEPVADEPVESFDEYSNEELSETVETPSYETPGYEIPVYETPVYETPSDEYSTKETEEIETVEEPVAEVAEVAEAVSEADAATDPNTSWWQEPKDEGDEGTSDDEATDAIEEDTEAFLEKVFSELETSEPEAEEGHGLLRRRRMGTLRDFSSDS